MKKKEAGKSKDAGYMFGLRKSFSLSYEEVWDYLFSNEGLPIWLGEISGEEIEIGKEMDLGQGVSGRFTVFKPFSHIRMTWNKSTWVNATRFQLRIIPSKNKTAISFCHEMLLDQQQRQEMKIHWNEVMNQLSEMLTMKSS